MTGEERTLWRRVARTVKARRPEAPEPIEHPAKSAPRKTAAKAAPIAKTKPKPPPTPPSVADRSNERRVRRGDVAVEAKLDLHGYTQDGARAAVHRFIASASQRGLRVVLIVTGKGRAGEEGVLRRRLPDWLHDAAVRPLIAGAAPAHRTHGGVGATYVFLKRKG